MERMLEEIKSFQGEGALWHYGEAGRLAVLAERELENTQGTQKQAGLLGQVLIISLKPTTCVPAGAASFFCRRDSTIGWARSMRPLRTTARRLMPVSTMRPRFAALELLYARQRYAEADEMLRRLEQQQAVSLTELGRLALEVSMRLENIDRAVEISQHAAEQSKDWADHLWLGELQVLLGNRALADQFPEKARARFLDAEKTLRRAVDLGRSTGDLGRADSFLPRPIRRKRPRHCSPMRSRKSQPIRSPWP